MSGGAFEYNQYKIRDIREEIEEILYKMGKEKSEEELKYFDREYLEKYPEERFHNQESEEVVKIFKDAVEILRKAEIYAHRIDWYLSGDDGRKSLISRLKEDLAEIKNKE